jgi:CheY-like chemotaxis protein
MAKHEINGEPVTVLLVEDNPAHAELVIRSFEDHRIANRIHHVSDGEEALDYLLRRGAYADPAKSPTPHMVLLDLRLPKIDGLEVLKEIKSVKELEKIPTVIFTTSSAEVDVAKAYGYHANSYLVKPINFEKFNQLMDDIGFYWLAWNHHPWGD